MLGYHFALDFSASDASGTITSVLPNGVNPGEVMRQRITLAGRPGLRVRVRIPHRADRVTALDAAGKPVPMESSDYWCSTAQPVNEVEFAYTGGVYAEDRRCTRLPDGPVTDKPFVLDYGPKLLAIEGLSAKSPTWPLLPADLETHGLKPLHPTFRDKDCQLVFDGID